MLSFAAAGGAVEEEATHRIQCKAVVVGDGECGKTCLLQRFCRDTYSSQGYLPTVFDTQVVDMVSGTTTVSAFHTHAYAHVPRTLHTHTHMQACTHAQISYKARSALERSNLEMTKSLGVPSLQEWWSVTEKRMGL